MNNFFLACKSFLFGEKCSLCHKKMHRNVDDWYPKDTWQVAIFLEYECKTCLSYMRARNYKWVNKSYPLVGGYLLHISASDPTVGDIYEPMRPEGVSYGVATIPINDIYVSMQDVERVNKLVNKIMLLT